MTDRLPARMTTAELRRYQTTGRAPGEPDLGDTPAKAVKRERRRDEDATQRAVVEWLHLVTPRLAAPWCAVPNGGGRNVIEAALLQGLGVVAGAPDLVFIAAGLELKSPRGSLSPAQREFRRACEVRGVPYGVARDLDEAMALVGRWGLLR